MRKQITAFKAFFLFFSLGAPDNALLAVCRKELRKVFLEYLQWMHAMKKDSTFQKVMQTQKDLKDTEGFDWQESIELAIDKRKFLLNRLFVKQELPKDVSNQRSFS